MRESGADEFERTDAESDGKSFIHRPANEIEVRFDGLFPDRGGRCLDVVGLTVTARAVQAHKQGVGEADCRGEAEENSGQEKDLL